jgi:hypothetical protein
LKKKIPEPVRNGRKSRIGMDGRKSFKKQKIEKKDRRTGCGRLIAMHVGWMAVCICMAGLFLV